MNVNLKVLTNAIDGVIKLHKKQLDALAPEKDDESKGFILGLEYVNKYIVPALENIEKEEIDSVVASMKNEIEDIKAAHRFGLDEM